jgi:hypothetical protein
MSPNIAPADGPMWAAALHFKILIYAVPLKYNTPNSVFQDHAVLRRGLKQEFPVYKDSSRTGTTPKRVIPLQALTKSKDKVIFKPLLRKCFVLRKVACNSLDGPTCILRRQQRFQHPTRYCLLSLLLHPLNRVDNIFTQHQLQHLWVLRFFPQTSS